MYIFAAALVLFHLKISTLDLECPQFASCVPPTPAERNLRRKLSWKPNNYCTAYNNEKVKFRTCFFLCLLITVTPSELKRLKCTWKSLIITSFYRYDWTDALARTHIHTYTLTKLATLTRQYISNQFCPWPMNRGIFMIGDINKFW